MKGLGLGIVQKNFFCVAVIARRVMRGTLRNSETFTYVDTHFSETASWNYAIDIPYERPQSRNCAEVQNDYFFITVIAQPVIHKTVHSFGYI